MKRAVRIAAAAALLGLVSAVAVLKISEAQCFSLTGKTICRVETRRPLVAITFDDGPTVQGLNAVLPQLRRYRAKGTFFLIGNRSEVPLVQRIVA